MTSDRVVLKKGYKPKKSEKYMCPEHLEYFRQKLNTWREELIEESRETISHLQSEVRDVGDEAERATRETENSLELRTRDRYRKLIRKIDEALTEASALEELQLVQERRDLNDELERMDTGVDVAELEAAFVGVAKSYAQRKGISYASWRDVGVSAATLKQAGITRAG